MTENFTLKDEFITAQHIGINYFDTYLSPSETTVNLKSVSRIDEEKIYTGGDSFFKPKGPVKPCTLLRCEDGQTVAVNMPKKDFIAKYAVPVKP